MVNYNGRFVVPEYNGFAALSSSNKSLSVSGLYWKSKIENNVSQLEQKV